MSVQKKLDELNKDIELLKKNNYKMQSKIDTNKEIIEAHNEQIFELMLDENNVVDDIEKIIRTNRIIMIHDIIHVFENENSQLNKYIKIRNKIIKKYQNKVINLVF